MHDPRKIESLKSTIRSEAATTAHLAAIDAECTKLESALPPLYSKRDELKSRLQTIADARAELASIKT